MGSKQSEWKLRERLVAMLADQLSAEYCVMPKTRIKGQVKRQQQAVSVDGLRPLMTALGDNDVGLFFCRGGFTKDAETDARAQEERRITLIGLEKLFDLLDEHYDKLTDGARRRLPLRSIRFLAPGG